MNSPFAKRRLHSYPIGAVVRVRMVSGREIEARIIRIETTEIGTFHHIEFDEEAATVTRSQIVGFYNFCFLTAAIMNKHIIRR